MNKDNLIYETENFTVERHPKPFVSREEGGHVRIFPKDKERVSKRRDLTPEEAIEFIRLSMVVGEALEVAMNRRGVRVVKINYEDLGNWAFKRGERPVLHLHVFGRAADAKVQVFPEAVQLPDRSTGFYDVFVALDEEDMSEIRKEIERIFSQEKYQDENWIQ